MDKDATPYVSVPASDSGESVVENVHSSSVIAGSGITMASGAISTIAPSRSRSSVNKSQGQNGSAFRSNHSSTDQSRSSVIGIREFLETFSDEQRALLGEAISSAILYYIDRDTPIWLDALGIIAPELTTRDRSRVVGEHLVVRSETRRSVRFEKCSELIAFQREQYPGVIETKELVAQVYTNLPLPLQLQWPERDLVRLVRTFFRWVKHEVVIDGYCSRLALLGELCSLHNRQGENVSDWYAGADIFLVPSYKQTIHVGQSRVFPRPVLNDAWELLSAAHGNPVKTFEINLTTELTGLGFSLNSQEQAWALENNKLKVAVFRVPVKQSPGAERRSAAAESRAAYIYCTDGLRHTSIESEQCRAGCELVFQLEVNNTDGARADVAPPRWPARALTMGWVLLQHTPNKVLRAGFGFSCNVPLVPCSGSEPQSELSVAVMRQEHEISTVTPNPRTHSSINAIFTTEFIAARGEHLTGNRAFRYINIVGVNEEEAVLAESRSARHLTMLLRHRGLDQFTKLSRPSLVARALVGRARESRTDTSSNQKPSHQSAAIQTTGHQKKNVDMNIDPASTPIH